MAKGYVYAKDMTGQRIKMTRKEHAKARKRWKDEAFKQRVALAKSRLKKRR